MKKSKYPKEWNEEKIRKVLTHYEEQTEEEALAEDEEAYENRTQTSIEVPVQLVPAVRELIAKYQAFHHLKKTADNTG